MFILKLNSSHIWVQTCKLIMVVITVLFTDYQSVTGQTKEKAQRPTPAQILAAETAPIATVNQTEVSLMRFNEIYEFRLSRVRQHLDPVPESTALRIKEMIANQLIDELLIMQAAKKRGVAVSKLDVDKALTHFASTFLDSEAFKTYISSIQKGKSGLRSELSLNLLKDRLAGIDINKSVSDEEVRAYYEQHVSQYHIPAHLVVQDIVFLVKQDAPAEQDSTQKTKAKEILGKVQQSNISFASLARRYSEAHETNVGGWLGRVTPGSIDSTLWNVLTNTDENGITGIIRAADGYHIMKLIKREPEVHQRFEQVRNSIVTVIRSGRRSAKVAELLTGLRATSEVENQLADRYKTLLQSTNMQGSSSSRLSSSTINQDQLPTNFSGNKRGTLQPLRPENFK